MNLENAKAINRFIIKVPKTHKEEIEVGGVKMYVDVKFNPHLHRVHYGTVVDSPNKLKGIIKKGSRIWFTHKVTALELEKTTKPQRLDGEYYYVDYDDTIENAINNQAFCYEDENGKIHPIGWFLLAKPTGTTHELKSQFLHVITKKPIVQNIGVVTHINDRVKEYFGIDVGDEICYSDAQRYEVNIDGEIYYKVRASQIMYVKEKAV